MTQLEITDARGPLATAQVGDELLLQATVRVTAVVEEQIDVTRYGAAQVPTLAPGARRVTLLLTAADYTPKD